MHVLFVHQNYPAQFGHVAKRLVAAHGWRCTFVSTRPGPDEDGVRRVRYEVKGGATESVSYQTRSFENGVAHALGVLDVCRRDRVAKPDLIVGHSGFGSTLFLREQFNCPVVNYFEYFYHPHGLDLDFRPEFPPEERDTLRAYCRNAMILLDLENCDAGYSPTRFQRSLLPTAYRDKVEAIFDGVDTGVWRRHPSPSRVLPAAAGKPTREVPPGTKVVTYAARGFESMRGFDIFMRTAKRVYREVENVLFVVIGSDQVVYGGDTKHIGGDSFLAHVLAQDDYDLSKFHFTGPVPPAKLAELMSLGDAHMYFTVPFVLSWSLFDALACGCAVAASDTPPVAEVISPGATGLLAGFYDVEGHAANVVRLLREPKAARKLGDAAVSLIDATYTLDRTLPRTIELYRRVLSSKGAKA